MAIPVALAADVREGEILGIEVEGRKLALYRVAGVLYATDDECSHVGCSLSKDGALDGLEVECLCHGSRFILPTGEASAPPAFDPIRTYPVSVEGDAVLIEVS